MKTFPVLLLFLFFLISSSYGDTSVRISGRLMCRNMPAQFTELQLVHKGWFSNTVLARNVFTDPSGYFELAGSYSGDIDDDAKLFVWHRCWDDPADVKDPCLLHFKIPVPRVQIEHSLIPKRNWKLGEIHLNQRRRNEETTNC